MTFSVRGFDTGNRCEPLAFANLTQARSCAGSIKTFKVEAEGDRLIVFLG